MAWRKAFWKKKKQTLLYVYLLILALYPLQLKPLPFIKLIELAVDKETGFHIPDLYPSCLYTYWFGKFDPTRSAPCH